MEKIVRDYAIIYIDRTGEIELKESEDANYLTTEEIVSDYYNNSGFLQWNTYIIIDKNLVEDDDVEKIENNDSYTRKFVLESEEIDKFIEDMFPVIEGETGKIKLIKGNSWVDACKKADIEQKENGGYLFPGTRRDKSSMDFLSDIDSLRSMLIKNPDMKAIFYTHMRGEYSLAEKKFKLFVED